MFGIEYFAKIKGQSGVWVRPTGRIPNCPIERFPTSEIAERSMLIQMAHERRADLTPVARRIFAH